MYSSYRKWRNQTTQPEPGAAEASSRARVLGEEASRPEEIRHSVSEISGILIVVAASLSAFWIYKVTQCNADSDDADVKRCRIKLPQTRDEHAANRARTQMHSAAAAQHFTRLSRILNSSLSMRDGRQAD